MNHYDFQKKFHDVYDRAIASYGKGARDAGKLLSTADVRWLESIGSRAQDLFDYAEDAANGGEPDYDTALLVQAARRDYFLTIQHGKPSKIVLDETKLPAKTDAVRGIEWLPRIIPKAKAKLHGELPTTLMYGCGGDRKFFKAHDIHPAEFLRVIWAWENDEAKIVEWVAKRSKAAKTAVAA
jgi:hypothetical protein